jgi:DNA-binding FadR family transcriptional regulator
MAESASTTRSEVTTTAELPVGTTPGEHAIYRQLSEAIDSGRFKPGDRLPPERDLAVHFGTTRNLVRRAVLRLERERRISREVGRGTFVLDRSENNAAAAPPLPKASPLDVLEARMAIEPGFADLVVGRATESDFDRLEGLLLSLEKAPTQQEFKEAGYAFHLQIARSTRNPLLIQIFETVIEARKAAGWGRLLSLNDTVAARQGQVRANRRILDALRERDAELARKLLRTHLGSMVAAVTFNADE